MVTRLTFKGDKLKVRKARKVVRRNAPQYTTHQIEESWTSATGFGDVSGPLMLCTQGPKAVSVNPMGALTLRPDLDLVGSSLNWDPEEGPVGYESAMHKASPVESAQVLIGSITNGQLTLKTPQGKYLANAGGSLAAESEAIGPSELFGLERVVKEDGVWFKITHDGEYLDEQLDFGNREALFVIRVQARNSVIGKRLLRDLQEPQGGDLDSALKSLESANIEITRGLIKRLQDASGRGKLNEQLLEEKQRLKSDSRC